MSDAQEFLANNICSFMPRFQVTLKTLYTKRFCNVLFSTHVSSSFLCFYMLSCFTVAKLFIFVAFHEVL